MLLCKKTCGYVRYIGLNRNIAHTCSNQSKDIVVCKTEIGRLEVATYS